VIPPLVPQLASECLRMFTDSLLITPKNGISLGEVVHRMRLLILKQFATLLDDPGDAGVARETACELALDVCLYASARFTIVDERPLPPEGRVGPFEHPRSW
jgi:hypothetical protein